MTERGTTPGRLARAGRAAETLALVGLLALLVVLAGAQIVMRNVFGTGLVWSDELLRIAVLWIALLGAVAASRDDRQINIDVLSRVLPPIYLRAVRVLTSAFTSFVAGVAAWASLSFLRAAWEYEDTLLGGLPSWPFQVVLPVGFALIAVRYAIHAGGYLLGKKTPGPAA